MRRDTRRKKGTENWWDDKRIIISGAVILAIIILIMGISIYSKNINDSTSKATPNQIISLAPEDDISETTESASSSIGNKVSETESASTSNNTTNNTNATTSTNTSIENTTNSNKANTTSAKETAEKINQKNAENQKEDNSNTKNETKQTNNTATDDKITFDWPVKGELLKAFSIDNLLYSSTLQEWTVHNGIDIKADKASVVSAATDGVIKTIKNDPRYGLTVTIEHSDGFKTVYANLLTAEFVVEGEKVSKGQNIGTVGNTANFEVADDFHLHFEILKDSQYVDPMIYLK